MTHADIAANARRPYVDAIKRYVAERDALANALRDMLADSHCNEYGNKTRDKARELLKYLCSSGKR